MKEKLNAFLCKCLVGKTEHKVEIMCLVFCKSNDCEEEKKCCDCENIISRISDCGATFGNACICIYKTF